MPFLRGSSLIRQENFDIIHRNNFSPIIAASALAKIHTIPLVTTIHDIFSIDAQDYWKKWADQNNVSRSSSILGTLFEKITVKLPTNVIHAPRNVTKDGLIKFKVKSEIRVIPNGINLSYYKTLGFKNDYQDYVLFIGRLVFYKNLGLVLSSFGEVVKTIPFAKLIIVGDGPTRDKWERETSELGLSKNVRFIGYISHEKKIELLSKCSALLLPNLHEGFGLVLLDVYAMSKPVLVADVKPFDEIVDDGKDGYIISAQDEKEWPERIISILSNNKVSEQMGKRGRLKMENKFNMSNIINQMELVYTKMIKRSLNVESVSK